MNDRSVRPRGIRPLRHLTLAGTAIAGSLAGVAGAQNVQVATNTDYSLTRTDTISGGPRTVDITTSSGNIVLDLRRVEVANPASANGAGVAATDTGPGNIVVGVTDVVATGAGTTFGIDARAATGNVTVTSNTITADTGAGNRGINVLSGGGLISITAGTTAGGQRGIFTGFNGGIAPAVTRITSGTATANGANQANAIVGQGTAVVIDSGTASLLNAAGTGGAAIFANGGTGGVTLTSALATTAGNNQAGIQVFSDGVVLLSSKAVRTAQSSDGIVVGSGTTIDLRSVTITTTGADARGIVLGGAGAGIAYTSANLVSGTIGTAGDNAYGIHATPLAGTTAIASTTITTAGQNAFGIYVSPVGAGLFTGNTLIDGGTIATTGIGATGVVVANGSGALGITAADIRTAGTDSNAVAVTLAAGAAQPITIDVGVVRTAGANTAGIVVAGGTSATTSVSVKDSITTGAAVDVRTTGNAAVSAGTVRVAGANATGLIVTSTAGTATVGSTDLGVTAGRGIVATGATGVTVTSGTLAVTGTDTGIVAQATGAGAVNVTSTTLTSGAGGIEATGNGAVAVASGTLTAGATDAIRVQGASASVDSTDLTVRGAGVGIRTQTTGLSTIRSAMIRGVDGALGGIVATTGAFDIISGTITGTGFGIDARATGTGAGTITSGTIAARGDGGFGISGVTDAGALSITSTGAISTTGSDVLINGQQVNAYGIDAVSNTGPIAVTSNTVTTTGVRAYGIYAEGDTAPVTVLTTGTTSTSGDFAGAVVVHNGDGPATVTTRGLVTTSGSSAPGIAVTSQGGTIAISNARTETTGQGSAGIGAVSLVGAIGITSASVATAGEGADGITANSFDGAVTIDSNTVATTGAGSRGIVAATRTGSIQLTAGTTTTVTTVDSTATGPAADAVFASSDTGAVSVTSRVASTASAGARAVRATSGGTVAVNSGSAATSGAGATAVEAVSTGADVSIRAASASTTGAGATAIDGRADAGSVEIINNVVNAANGVAISAVAGRTVTVSTLGAATGGDGNAAVLVAAGTGAGLTIASATTTGATLGDRRADAVFVQTAAGQIGATLGSATASGAGADAVRLIANGQGGAVAATVGGNLSSATANGLFIQSAGANAVTLRPGATITGQPAGLSFTGMSNTLINTGAITGRGGPGVVATGATTIDNSGSIAGANGVAVQLGAAKDSVIVRTGASFGGRINGGGGIDAATLIGGGTTPQANQVVPGFDGFDSLTVQSGYWTGDPGNGSSFTTATINGGATLAVTNGLAGIVGVRAATFVDNGTLVVRDDTGSANSAFGGARVVGSGAVLFTGAGVATLDGTNTIASAGAITVDNGSRVVITGTQGGAFVTTLTGTLQIGTGGTTGSFTGSLVDNGQAIVNRSDDVTLPGALSGTGALVKQGAGRLIVGSGFAFTGRTLLQGGSIRLAQTVSPTAQLNLEGAGLVDLSGTTQTVAQLSGTSRAIDLNIAGGSLTVAQASDTTYAGTISGAGGTFTKAGAGTLRLIGASTYTGATAVIGGRLLVDGSLASAVTVGARASLGGVGRIGGLTVASGGTVAPGNGIGTLTVAGPVAFAAGSIYALDVAADGSGDRIAASGAATLGGGTVQVNAGAGSFGRLTGYTILTAAGGVTGQFAGVTTNYAFLSPLLGYSANAVTLTLARNDLAFGTAATTPNGAAVANAVAGRTLGDPIYNAILFSTGADAAGSFAQLAGELHPTLATELVDNGRRVREAVMTRERPEADGFGLWAAGLKDDARSRSQGALFQLRANRTGGIGGLDYRAGGFDLGVYGAYQDDKVQVHSLASSARVKTVYAGFEGEWRHGPLLVQAGGDYAWYKIDTRRQLSVPGLAGTLTASPDAHGIQLYAEAGYRLTTGALTVTPFVRNAFVATRVDAFTEAGGAAALSIDRQRRDVDVASLGLHVAGDTALGSVVVRPRATVAYERGVGDLGGDAVAHFAGTGPAFGVKGVRLASDAVTADGGVDLLAGQRLRFGLSGFGSTSSRWRDYGGRVSAAVRF